MKDLNYNGDEPQWEKADIMDAVGGHSGDGVADPNNLGHLVREKERI